jgi:hypothetical protein
MSDDDDLRLAAVTERQPLRCAPIVLCSQRIRLAWLRTDPRRSEIFSTSAAFLVSFAVCFVGLGYVTYAYATWLLGG